MYGYIGWRLIIPAALGYPYNVILWVLLAIFVILPFMPIVMRMNGIQGTWAEIVSWIGYTSFGFFTILFAVLIVKDLILLGGSGVKWLVNMFGGTELPKRAPDPERRRIVANAIHTGLLSFTGVMMAYGLFKASRRPEIINVSVPIKNLPAQFEDFKIAQITDVHVSYIIDRDFVEMIVEETNRLNPDMIVITGDMVDGPVEQLGEDIESLADLKAPYGTYFITGNHEYYSGVHQWLDKISKLGITVLINEHRIIERGGDKIILAGVTDFNGGRFSKKHISDPKKAIEGAPDGIPKILLAHQPKSIVKASDLGYDYVISGHTHGGQYLPYRLLVAIDQPFVSGFHRRNDTHIYVSEGTGYWGPPIRIGTTSEITVHKLKLAV